MTNNLPLSRVFLLLAKQVSENFISRSTDAGPRSVDDWVVKGIYGTLCPGESHREIEIVSR